MNLQEKWQRILKARDLIPQVQQMVWWYNRPHLISIEIQKDYDTDDNGGLVTYYTQSITITVESNGDEIWLDAEYIPTRVDPRLQCILEESLYTEDDIGCVDFCDHIPPIIEENGIDDNDITLYNPYPTLEEIETSVCEF